MSRGFWRLWGQPLLLALLTTIGLLTALVGDGWWDAISAVTLGLPVFIGGWHALRSKPADRVRTSATLSGQSQ